MFVNSVRLYVYFLIVCVIWPQATCDESLGTAVHLQFQGGSEIHTFVFVYLYLYICISICICISLCLSRTFSNTIERLTDRLRYIAHVRGNWCKVEPSELERIRKSFPPFRHSLANIAVLFDDKKVFSV